MEVAPEKARGQYTSTHDVDYGYALGDVARFRVNAFQDRRGVCGVLLLASIIVPGLLARVSPTGRVAMTVARLRSVLASNLSRTAPEALFLTGALNGLLPCGLLYAALLGAVNMSTPAQGALFMVLFGIGTWPALFAVRMGAGLFGDGMRVRLRRLSPVLISAVAVLMVLRGLELGIPYVSPGPVAPPAEVSTCH